MGKISLSRCHVGGFTLIEIVVAAGIMALFSLTLISVFLATVRGGSKAHLTQAAHQEGDFALKQMASTIRSAASASCNGETITVTTINGATVVFSLVDDDGVTRVASDSSRFLTGKLAQASNLNFTCYQAYLGNQVVTITLELRAQPAGTGQAQEQFAEEFTTSVSTRQF